MSLLLLIVLLLGGGIIAWLAERVSPTLPGYIAVTTITLAILYLAYIAATPAIESVVSSNTMPSDWSHYWRVEWIPRFGISMEFGMDGVSFLMVGLTLLLGLIAISSSWSEIDFKPGLFQANILWTLAGVCGVFLALDLFLFFLFWEVMLIPMYLLIAVWGHEKKAYAAMKFFIFTQVSGLLMLLSIVILASQAAEVSGQWSFSYFDLLAVELDGRMAMVTMLGFFLAFTVKLPGFPFHTWLPDAHTQAPTAGSVLLAGILLKTGAYGLLRFSIPLFPEASQAFAPVAISLGVAGIIYGAILAFAQTDFKRLVAYSSVSHMGFVLLGLYAWNSLALQGAIMQMIAHGVSTAALFMLAGALQQRLHTRDMRRMSGLWHQAPRMGACAMFFAMASLGLPGLGNFIGEFMVLAGLFVVRPWFAAVAALGLITAAVYSLWMIQQAFQGKPVEGRAVTDFGKHEMCTMWAMVAALVWLGLYPQPILDLATPVADAILQQIPASMQAVPP